MAIAVVLSVLLSVFLYHIATVELKEGLNQFRALSVNDNDGDEDINLTNHEYDERASQLFIQIVYFNLVVILLSTTGSLFLARRTLKPIQEVHEAQVRFTAHASHELKTPLSAIRADTESVLMMKQPDEVLLKRTLKANLRDVRRMDELANHLLNAARLRSVKPVDLVKLDLKPLARQAIAEIRRTAGFKGARIKLTAASVEVTADPIAIKQVMLSLIENALKYSGNHGSVELNIYRQGKTALMVVSDSGPGFSKQDLPHIFEPFYRSSSNEADVDGFGLGLSLAQEVVKNSGGSIEAKNAKSGGAEITVKLPVT